MQPKGESTPCIWQCVYPLQVSSAKWSTHRLGDKRAQQLHTYSTVRHTVRCVTSKPDKCRFSPHKGNLTFLQLHNPTKVSGSHGKQVPHKHFRCLMNIAGASWTFQFLVSRLLAHGVETPHTRTHCRSLNLATITAHFDSHTEHFLPKLINNT
jgi:hypothetical protein